MTARTDATLVARATRPALLLGLALTLGCGAKPPPLAAPKHESKPLPQPACVSNGEQTSRTLAAVVETQRAYLERGDTKPFSLLLLSDAHVEAGRARAPGAFDLPISKSQLLGIYQWAAQNDGQSVAKFTTVEAQATSDSVSIELRLDLVRDGEDPASFSQQFELACHSGAWRIDRFRYWPLDPDTGQDFAQFFQDTDATIERELNDGDLRNAAYHLMLAYRFSECAALSRRLTSDTPDEPWVWDIRARASAMIGDRDDADRSIQLARSLAQGAHP